MDDNRSSRVAQQWLVHTIVTLQLARRAFDADPERARTLLGEALHQAEQSKPQLRELAHGILPAVLIPGGLVAGVRSLFDRVDVPVDVNVAPTRLAPRSRPMRTSSSPKRLRTS